MTNSKILPHWKNKSSRWGCAIFGTTDKFTLSTNTRMQRFKGTVKTFFFENKGTIISIF